MKKIINKRCYVFAFIVLLTVLSASLYFTQGSETITTGSTRDVSVGDFIVKLPINWRPYSASESNQLLRQYTSQSEDIYRQYSGGAPDPAKSVHIGAFHLTSDAGAFAIVSFTVPPQSDLIKLLMKQADEKARWGIREGFIKEYLGIELLEDHQLSGFYVKLIGKGGDVQVSGVLKHNKLKDTLIQLTLLCPKSWDELKATKTITPILESVKLRERDVEEGHVKHDQNSRQEDVDVNFTGKGISANDVLDIILDKKNKLIWQRSTVDGIDYASAIAYCENLELAGRTDWRVPTKNELIAGFEIIPRHEGFSQGETFIHWSSTETHSGHVEVVFRNINTEYGVLGRERTWTPGGATIGVRCLCNAK